MARQTYTIIHDDWQDQPSEETPIMAEDLEHIEAGIKEAMDSRALKEIYGDHSIRLSTGNEESTNPDIVSVEVGDKAKATGKSSVAMGDQVEASGIDSFSTGLGTKAIGANQFVCGRYNVGNANYIFIIGGGNSDSARANIHTVDNSGNAWFKGDVANDKYSLNVIGAKLDSVGTTDVTEESTVSMSGQILEVTVPLNIIMNAYGNIAFGADFLGIINFNGIPPMLFNLQTAGVRNGRMSGEAVLINTVPSSAAVYGDKFEGEIEFLLTNPTAPKAKVTFDLGRNGTVSFFTIYRTAGSAVDFSIAQLREDLKTVFTSVSEGKERIASAITDKGVETGATDTFSTMAQNILDIPTDGGGKYEFYAGVYNLIPKVSEQSVETKDKVMKDNVTVAEIPFHEVSNETGTTVVIGGIV